MSRKFRDAKYSPGRSPKSAFLFGLLASMAVVLASCGSVPPQPDKPIRLPGMAYDATSQSAYIWTSSIRHGTPFLNLADYATVVQIGDIEIPEKFSYTPAGGSAINTWLLEIPVGRNIIGIKYIEDTLVCAYLGCLTNEKNRQKVILVALPGRIYVPFVADDCAKTWVWIEDWGNYYANSEAKRWTHEFRPNPSAQLAAGERPPIGSCAEKNSASVEAILKPSNLTTTALSESCTQGDEGCVKQVSVYLVDADDLSCELIKGGCASQQASILVEAESLTCDRIVSEMDRLVHLAEIQQAYMNEVGTSGGVVAGTAMLLMFAAASAPFTMGTSFFLLPSLMVAEVGAATTLAENNVRKILEEHQKLSQVMLDKGCDPANVKPLTVSMPSANMNCKYWDDPDYAAFMESTGIEPFMDCSLWENKVSTSVTTESQEDNVNDLSNTAESVENGCIAWDDPDYAAFMAQADNASVMPGCK